MEQISRAYLTTIKIKRYKFKPQSIGATLAPFAGCEAAEPIITLDFASISISILVK